MTEGNKMWWPPALYCTYSLLIFAQLVPLTQMSVSESGNRHAQLLEGNYSSGQSILCFY
jgi:hypothetical protein